MAKNKTPITSAVRVLRREKVEFTDHLYDYVSKGGTKESSQQLGVPEHQVVKTLVFADEHRNFYLVLMHGDREVSAKALARTLGVKTCAPCLPEVANRLTGYQVGGISPFGTRRELPVLVESTILHLDRLFINGGKRGYLVSLKPCDLQKILKGREVSMAR